MADSRSLYIDLLQECILNAIYDDGEIVPLDLNDPQQAALGTFCQEKGYHLVAKRPIEQEQVEVGSYWPRSAHSMLGRKRLGNLRRCIESVLERNIPGDVIETGVWRGGAMILARGILKAYDVTDRKVWVADSFAGLPQPNEEAYPADRGDPHHTLKFLAVSLDEVKQNFSRYGLLDGQVEFLQGWFKDTLPTAPVESLAVLRLDGDMYESTMDSLTHLYPKLSPGGFLIVDDYGCIPACAEAVEDYRKAHGISDPIRKIDWTGVYWEKSGPPAPSNTNAASGMLRRQDMRSATTPARPRIQNVKSRISRLWQSLSNG